MTDAGKQDSTPSLQIRTEAVDRGITILRCAGAVDSHTFTSLSAAIVDLLREGQCRIVVDVSDVGYISSSGVRVFLEHKDSAKACGGDIVLLNLGRNEKAHFVFQALGIDSLFTYAVTEDKALAAFD